MEITGPPLVRPDARVRVATADQIDQVLHASVAMFTEELGFPPPDHGGGYRHHVAQLLSRGAIFARFANDGVTIDFKADLGASFGDQAQIQGVWTRPEQRGRGLAKSGVAAVVQAAADRGIRTVSLYVNDFNQPAIAAYRAVGFQQIGTFATVMF